MPHRPPTRFDIGKQVEARSNESDWDAYTLTGIWHQAAQTRYFICGGEISYVAEHCRVPYDCPDPQAELCEAADWLAERGLDEAARVLMLWLSLSDRCKDRLSRYQPGDSVSVFRTLLDELTGRQSWRSVESLAPNPPEPQP